MRETWKLVSYNLRCTWDNDGINSFVHRAASCWISWMRSSQRWYAFRRRRSDCSVFKEYFRIKNCISAAVTELDGEDCVRL
ncbi:MAG: hypothetical protein ACLRJV_09380 [Eubacteriales bacterium]